MEPPVDTSRRGRHHALPRPDEIKSIVLAHRVDEAFWVKRSNMDRWSLEEFHRFLVEKFGTKLDGTSLKYRYPGDPESCLNLITTKFDRPVALWKLDPVLAYLGWELGIYPASFYEFLPQFRKEFRQQYRYSFVIRCKHGRRECLRIDHLTIFTYLGHPVLSSPPSAVT